MNMSGAKTVPRNVTNKNSPYENNDFMQYVTLQSNEKRVKTHIVETGKSEGVPLLVFYGGNSTTAYNLLMCKFLLEDFHIYAVDIIGHPGKSDEVCLLYRGYDYGKWAGEVIDKLGYEKIACFGGSFGGGVAAKLICISPKKIRKAVLVVPAGISNALPISSLKMMIPLLQYHITKTRSILLEQSCIWHCMMMFLTKKH